VWIAASTHEGEELPVFEAHLSVLARLPDALLLIAPRHPERFRSVEHSARNLGFSVATHSGSEVPDRGCQCFVIDAMGAMMRHYAASDLAFVAGSLVPIGGHNVLEPASLAKPVLVGPYTFNFEEITASLIEGGGARRVESARELGAAVLELLRDAQLRQRMGMAARVVFARERGAVRRTMVLIERIYARSNEARMRHTR
jgi:3-deoxy-D-manno-octulosonic-acid transferase